MSEINTAQLSNRDTIPRVAFLSATFYGYRVPLFDLLAQHFQGNFIVIALASITDQKAREAANMGRFRRFLVHGIIVDNRYLTRRTLSGQKTPVGPIITPGLTRVLRTFHPDIVISSNLGVWTLTSILFGYPTIIYWEGTAHTERTVGTTRLLIRRWMARRAAAFVVNGKQARDYVASTLRASDKSIFEGGMGPEPPPRRFSSAAQTAKHNTRVHFLFVGRLIPLKGISHLLRAARLLLDQGHSVNAFDIMIVGDGPERGLLTNLTRELGIDAIVRFIGNVGSSKIWDFYRECDILVLPTLQDNWPLVVPEAMSMGKAILVSKFAGSALDLVQTGANGFTFDPNDHAELARLMSFYIDHPDAAAAHGSHGRQIASQYTPAKVAQSYIEAVESVWH